MPCWRLSPRNCDRSFGPDDDIHVTPDYDIYCDECADRVGNRVGVGPMFPVPAGGSDEEIMQHACVLHAAGCAYCPDPMTVMDSDPEDRAFCDRCWHIVLVDDSEPCLGCKRYDKWVRKISSQENK
jgi:hypothetical protein